MNIKAMIFNLCGTIVDLRPLRFRSMTDVLKREGIHYDLNPEIIDKRFSGLDDLTIVHRLVADGLVPAEQALSLCWKLEDGFAGETSQAIERGDLAPFRGSLEFLKRLHENKIQIAIVSETSTSIARMVVRRLAGLATDAVIGADSLNPVVWDFYMERALEEAGPAIEDGPGGKELSTHLLWTTDPVRIKPDDPVPFPNRRYYELALDHLDVLAKPEEALVFEDSADGGTAAKSAGFRIMLVAHSSNSYELRKVSPMVLEGIPEIPRVLARLFEIRFDH